MQKLHNEMEDLRRTLQAHSQFSAQVEDQLNVRCSAIEATVENLGGGGSGLTAEGAKPNQLQALQQQLAQDAALRDERLGAAETTVEWLRQDLHECRIRLQEEQAQLTRDHERLSERCADFVALAKDGILEITNSRFSAEVADLGSQLAELRTGNSELVQHVFGKTEGCVEAQLVSLREEIASIEARQQLHALVFESLSAKLA